MAIWTLSASVVWKLEIVIGAFVLSDRAIFSCDDCGRRLCRVGDENPRVSDLCGVCCYDLCLRLGAYSDHCHCLDCDFDAASDL